METANLVLILGLIVIVAVVVWLMNTYRSVSYTHLTLPTKA